MGQEQGTVAGRMPEKRNVMQEKVVLVKAQGMDKQKFVDNFREAVFQTMMLLFERRELELGEPSTTALHLLLQVAKDMEVVALPNPTSSTSKSSSHGH